MQRTMLKSKIHRVTVTHSELGYEGSCAIDESLMEAADILPYEQVDVVNVNNGARFTTYAIEGEAGSGCICLNGAAARLAVKGDIVIILSYTTVPEEEVKDFKPKIVHVNEKNAIVTRLDEKIFA